MRLIDADALLEKMKKTDRYFNIKFDIEEAPTVNMWSLVLDDLLEVPMFRMEYDAKNGNEHFMYGIATIMEHVAYKADREDEYTRIFNDGLNLSRSKVVETTCD